MKRCRLENGTGEFFVRGKEEVFALAFETFGYFLVPFMTEKNLNVVLVEHAVPVEELIVCVARCAGMSFVDITAVGLGLP